MSNREPFPQGSIDIQFKLTFKGGIYDSNVSDLYDGIEALDGFSKMLHITTHAYINQEVIRKATALKGAKIYRTASRPGSFVEVINVVLEHPVEAIATKVVYDGLYDFVKYVGAKAIGKAYSPKNRKVKKLVRDEPFISALNDSVRKPVKEMHRPIVTDRNVRVEVGKPRTPLLLFNEDSYLYLKEERLLDLEENLSCNVTKMNTLSPHGRIYLDSERKTVSYEADDGLSFSEGLLLSKSLDDTKNRRNNKINIDVRKLVDGNGRLLKIFIYGVR
ncbi:hypothetical protein [Vreelandella zhaodongensis]|uniref:DUF7946 domain-containing protein n=1 Tax=Vreelandella zhaodongensis TaxID=1176240 RepID=A0ABX2SSW7_VREZH|nr:hypothetical protein [Halomonas zhaodongensis]NYS45143.1 hypothetical protein [Halomonas zhaodongensis]